VRYAVMFSLKVASEIWLRPGRYSDWLQPFRPEKDQVSVSTTVQPVPVVALPQRDSQNKLVAFYFFTNPYNSACLSPGETIVVQPRVPRPEQKPEQEPELEPEPVRIPETTKRQTLSGRIRYQTK
jgi:hypothetical protein